MADKPTEVRIESMDELRADIGALTKAVQELSKTMREAGPGQIRVTQQGRVLIDPDQVPTVKLRYVGEEPVWRDFDGGLGTAIEVKSGEEVEVSEEHAQRLAEDFGEMFAAA